MEEEEIEIREGRGWKRDRRLFWQPMISNNNLPPKLQDGNKLMGWPAAGCLCIDWRTQNVVNANEPTSISLAL